MSVSTVSVSSRFSSTNQEGGRDMNDPKLQCIDTVIGVSLRCSCGRRVRIVRFQLGAGYDGHLFLWCGHCVKQFHPEDGMFQLELVEEK